MSCLCPNSPPPDYQWVHGLPRTMSASTEKQRSQELLPAPPLDKPESLSKQEAEEDEDESQYLKGRALWLVVTGALLAIFLMALDGVSGLIRDNFNQRLIAALHRPSWPMHSHQSHPRSTRSTSSLGSPPHFS